MFRRLCNVCNLGNLAAIALIVLAGYALVVALGSPSRTNGSPPPAGQHAPAAASRPAGPAPEHIQLAAVQMRWRLEDYATAEGFAARVDGLMKQVADRLDPRYPALVVFPEDVGILTALTGEGDALAGATTLEAAVEKMVRRHMAAVLWNRARYGASWPRAVFLTRHETMARTYLETFSAAAKKYGVYLVAGSAPLPEYDLPPDGSLPGSYRLRGGAVYNTSYFFGPDGRIIGRQHKAHLIDLEGAKGLDLVPGNAADLRVFDTPLGKVGIAICLDAFQDDVIDRLRQEGAQILVQPSANPEAWTPEQQADWLNGSWKAVADRGLFAYAVNPMMAGQVLNLGFFGQSSIIARDPVAAAKPGAPPLGYTDTGPRPGFIAVADTDDQEEVLVVKVPHPSAPPPEPPLEGDAISCGTEVIQLDGDPDTRARDCLWQAYEEGRAAEFTTTHYTTEGDPITYEIRTLTDGRVQVHVDSNDKFGLEGRFNLTCSWMERKPGDRFDLKGCAGDGADYWRSVP